MKPYQSPYYQIDQYYEMFGNVVIPRGQEYFFYITDKEIPGIEYHRYSISNRLRVYDYVRQTFIIPRGTTYKLISLHNQEKDKYIDYLLHRIYMLVFCYFPGCEKMEVNHIDGDKGNPSPDNLEWVTHTGNMNHAINTGLLKHKFSEQDIITIIDRFNAGESVPQIAKDIGMSKTYIYEILRGKCPNHRPQPLIEDIKKRHPITRPIGVKKPKTPNIIKEAAERYSNGEEYYVLADEYGIDRSWLTKAIKHYAKSHPEIKIRDLKLLDAEMAAKACKIFEERKSDEPLNQTQRTKLYREVLEKLELEDNVSNRKAVSNVYNGKTHTDISSKYNYR